MSKEKILKEFDEKFNRYKLTFDECASLDADYWEAREYLIKAIDQTREEMIREVEEMLPRKSGMVVTYLNEQENKLFNEWKKGKNNCLKEIKQSLKSLINK